jgi:hypothetical protein
VVIEVLVFECLSACGMYGKETHVAKRQSAKNMVFLLPEPDGGEESHAWALGTPVFQGFFSPDRAASTFVGQP